MGKTVDDLVTKTLEGIDIKALYIAEDTNNLETVDNMPVFRQLKNPMHFTGRI